jgi:hypothetical protein
MRSMLPVHPCTGLTALGIVGGRPVWPVLGAEDPPEPNPTDPPAEPPTPPPADPGQDPPAGPQSVDELPEWAQKIIHDTRAEAAEHRTGKQQAETDKQATLDAVATALGLKPDTEPPDPGKLAADLAAAQSESRQRAVELAVHRAAGKHGGDPEALLDSRSFATRVGELDPSAGDFTDKVTEAVKTAVEANPKLAAQAGQEPPDLGQGRRTSSGPTGVQAGRAMYQERKQHKTPIIS